MMQMHFCRIVLCRRVSRLDKKNRPGPVDRIPVTSRSHHLVLENIGRFSIQILCPAIDDSLLRTLRAAPSNGGCSGQRRAAAEPPLPGPVRCDRRRSCAFSRLYPSFFETSIRHILGISRFPFPHPGWFPILHACTDSMSLRMYIV